MPPAQQMTCAMRRWAGAQILSAVLPSLAPGQTVYYTVGDDGYGVYSQEFSFVAPPAANSSATTTVRPRRMLRGGAVLGSHGPRNAVRAVGPHTCLCLFFNGNRAAVAVFM